MPLLALIVNKIAEKYACGNAEKVLSKQWAGFWA